MRKWGCSYAVTGTGKGGRRLYDQMDVRRSQILDFLNEYGIREGSDIRVFQQGKDGIIIGRDNVRLAIGEEVARRIQV